MPSPEQFMGTDAEKFSQMLAVPGSHTADGEYTVDEPILVTADVSLDCTGATFHGDSLTRGGSAPETFFRVQNGSGGTFAITGGEFRNGHFLSIQNDLASLNVDIESFVQDDASARISLIPQSSVVTRTTTATVRCRFAENCNLIFSTTFGGSSLDVRFDEVSNGSAYICRARPSNEADQWDVITLHDTVVTGIHDSSVTAFRVYQSLVKPDVGLSVIRNVSLSDVACDGFVSLAYWSTGNLLVENCEVTSISSGADERIIESKSLDDTLAIVRGNVFDQTGIDPAVSSNPCVDAKNRRCRVYNNTCINGTGPLLQITLTKGLTAHKGIRQCDRNMVTGHRYPAVIAIANHVPGEVLTPVHIRENVVTSHSNPSRIAMHSATTCRFVDIYSSSGSSVILLVQLQGNQYESSASGACCGVRFNLYDADGETTDFTRGSMVKELAMLNNMFTLPGGWRINWRNGVPLTVIKDQWNKTSGIVADFGTDSHTAHTIVPTGYSRNQLTPVMAGDVQHNIVRRSIEAEDVASELAQVHEG